MRKQGRGRVGALFIISIATMFGCGDSDVVDPKSPTLVIEPSSVTVAEGGSTTFKVSLSEALPLDGAVQITVANTGAATVSPEVITFTAGETAAKTITVTGVEDNNLAPEMTQIVISSADTAAASIPVTVTDNDTQALVLSTAAATITEGMTGTFGVHLAFEPTADTSVTLTSADALRLGVPSSPLTFTAANYGTDQTVTLTALEDADVVANTVVVTAASAGLVDGTVTVTIADNDVQGLSISVPSLALTEGGTPGTFQVTLTQAPSADVVINLASSKVLAATVSPATLTFTPANYNTGTAHVVTVTPVDDNNTAAETLAVTLAGGGLTGSVPVTVADDDVQSIVAASPITVVEGATVQLPVSLAFDPGAAITVTVASADATIAGASPTTLTFNSANYATPQNVAITGTPDTDVANESTTLALTSAGVVTKSVSVNVTDDDVQAITLGVTGPITLPEGTDPTPSTTTVGVTLAFQPGATTTVTVASNNANLTAAPATLTFTTANWNVAQNVTLRALDENNVTDDTASVTFTATGLTTRTLVVNIPDADVQSFLVTPATLPAVAEGGMTTFTVKLNLPPTSSVTATIASSSTNVLVNGAASATITITPANTATTITLTTLQDADAANDVATITITDNASTIAARNLTLNVTDDDLMAFVLTPVTSDTNRLQVTEEAADVTFTVALSAAPTANSTVTFTPSATNVVAVSTDGTNFAASTTLVFTPTDYAAKTITVRGLPDPNLVDETFTIDVVGPAGLGAAPASVFVRKIENDAQAIVTVPVEPGPLSVTEGTAQQLGVRLQYQPATTIQVMVAPSASSITLNGTSAPVMLLFTTTNYDQLQNVAVGTPQDTDQFDPSAGTILVSSPALTSRTIGVNLFDEDDQAIVLSAAAVSIQEPMATSSSATFTVKLAFKPTAGDETITATVPAAGLGKVQLCDGAGANCANTFALTFLDAAGVVGGWDQTQTLTVKALDDVDVLNETVAIGFTSNRAPNPTATFTVTVADDDQLNAVITPSNSATVYENGVGGYPSYEFAMKLNFNPTTSITIDLTSLDTSGVTVSPSTLTFTSANFNTTQLFTVTQVPDNDLHDESVTVEISNATMRIPTVPLTISVVDDDQQALVNDTGLQIDEGSSQPLSVKLSFQPAANVVVDVASAVTTGGSLAPGQAITLNGTATTQLTFTPANYATAQIITVAAPEDADLDHFVGNITLHVASAQTSEELAADAVATFAVRDNDAQGITLTASPAGLVNSTLEGATYVEYLVKLTARPRLGLSDAVTMMAPANVAFLAGGTNTQTLTFSAADFATPQTVRWRLADNISNTNFTGAIAIATTGEASDQAAPFGAANVNPAVMQAIRGFDDDTQQIIDGSDFPTGFNGATSFTQRSNIAFGLDGSAEGIVAFTARDAVSGGNALLGFTDRALATETSGPQFATAGGEPTTEIVLFNADGAGSWDVFGTSTNGIVFARYTLAGLPLVAPSVVSPATDGATDFSASRNGAAYGVVYRRTTNGNLYLRTVAIATGVASTEQQATAPDSFPHFHPTLHTVGGSFNGTAAPYAVLYTANGTNRIARLTATGAPVASYSFTQAEFPGTNFSASTWAYAWGNFHNHIWAASVKSTSTGIEDNAVFLYEIHLNTSGQVANVNDSYQLTAGDDLAPVSMPSIAYNGNATDSPGDFAISYDSGVAGVNQVGVALWNQSEGARDYRLTAVGDEGSYPSIAWAFDRWILRYQANGPSQTGIRLRTGSFEGPAVSPP